MVVLYGRPGSGPGIAFITDMNTIADEGGFLVVYPEALYDGGWNYIEDLPGYNPHLQRKRYGVCSRPGRRPCRRLHRGSGAAVRHRLRQWRLHGPTARPRGLRSLYRLCLRLPSSAPPFPEYVVPCAQASPAPVLFMHGTQDVGIPWDGIRAQVVGRERIATFFAPETWLGSLAVGEVQRRKHSIVVYGQRVFLPCLRRGANQDDVMLASNMTSA